ncbi:hypothetical protein [Faecalicatena contorta]|uniref:hypothetical protein n=1 Tax=Faecalicatena contorta TaxID=39482 RepID=UPI001F31116F|nr:hypothetical protein [Faecalicatena contorta]MCF2554380.1 hypothetical protein [Faecalicatena contorta]
MWGLFENLGCFLEDVGMAVTDKILQTDAKIYQSIHASQPVKITSKNAEILKQLIEESRELQPFDDDEQEDISGDKLEYYVMILQAIADHKDIRDHNPIDVGIECGYPEEDVKQAIEILRKFQNM